MECFPIGARQGVLKVTGYGAKWSVGVGNDKYNRVAEGRFCGTELCINH